jgi:hypothetical protein
MAENNQTTIGQSLKDLGFDDNTLLQFQLETELKSGKRQFILYTKAFYDEYTKLLAELHFCKASSSGHPILVKYETVLCFSDDPAKNRSQTFYINNGTGVTLREAYNLLQGRSVNKNIVSLDSQQYNAWIKINFSKKDGEGNYKVHQYRSSYGYDLEKVLEKYPIRELQSEETKASLIRSLCSGNMQICTFDKPTKAETMNIEANPMFKTINIYPAKGSRT